MLPHLRSTSSTTPPAGQQQQRQVPFPHRYTRAEVENNEDTRMVLGVVAPSDGQYNTMSRKAFTKDNTCAGSGTAAAITTGGNKSSYAISNPPYMYYDSDPRSSQPDFNVSRTGGSHHHHAQHTANGQQMPHQRSTINVGASAPSGYTTESRSMLSKPPVDVYQELKKRPPAEVNRQNRLANNTANFVFSSVDGQVDPLAEKKHLAGRHSSMGKPTPSSMYSQEHHLSPATSTTTTTTNASSTGAAPVGSGGNGPVSTVRSDFCQWDNKEVKVLRDEAAACRAKQQQTNYRLGIDTSVWASEARNYGSTAMGNRNSVLQAAENRAMAKHQKLASQFTLGSSDMVDKDLPTVEHVSPEGKVEMRRQMATLKQMDFKPFTVDPSEFRNKSNVAAQDDRFVLGHRGVKKSESVYRSSFTPTKFV